MEKERFCSCSLDEQETTISFSRAENKVDIWTNDRTMITKLDALCESCPTMYISTRTGKNKDGETMDKSYKIMDKSMISFRTKKKTFQLTEEQRAERAERLARNVGR